MSVFANLPDAYRRPADPGGGCTAAASAKGPSRLASRDGFTLLEMVVVTALLAIMMVVAIPRLSGNLLSDGDGETARWIIATVSQLKQKAVNDRQTYFLNVSLDTQQLWIAPADLADAETAAARDDGYRLPRGVNIDHVAFSREERLSSGTVPIGFYPAGYSDKSVIRLRTRDGGRLAFFIEPFLAEVNLVRGDEGWR